MKLLFIFFVVTLVLTCLFSVSDQASGVPHTHGRGVNAKGRLHIMHKNHGTNGFISVPKTDDTHSSKGHTQPGHSPFHRPDKSSSTRIGADRFRPPNKRKNS